MKQDAERKINEMKLAGLVGLLAVMGTSCHLLHSWIPDSEFSALCQLGKWVDLEGRVSQYACSLLTGNHPDPSSTPFLLWTGLRFVAAALLLYGVTDEQRRGNWLRPYKLQLKLSFVLWLVSAAYCAASTNFALSVGLIIAARICFMIFIEDPALAIGTLGVESARGGSLVIGTLSVESARGGSLVIGTLSVMSACWMILDSLHTLYVVHSSELPCGEHCVETPWEDETIFSTPFINLPEDDSSKDAAGHVAAIYLSATVFNLLVSSLFLHGVLKNRPGFLYPLRIKLFFGPIPILSLAVHEVVQQTYLVRWFSVVARLLYAVVITVFYHFVVRSYQSQLQRNVKGVSHVQLEEKKEEEEEEEEKEEQEEEEEEEPKIETDNRP